MRRPDGEEVAAVLALRTLGAPERRTRRSRRGRSVSEVEPEPVPTTRVTVIQANPFPSSTEADAWLADLRGRGDAGAQAVEAAVRHVNRALHAHRVSRADPYAAEISAERALVVRVGYGSGEEVAEGRFAQALEMTERPRRARRSMEAPEERFAAILGGRDSALPAEELVLRARADLDAGRGREAALQARVALESLLAAIGEDPRRHELDEDRGAVGQAANAALKGALPDDVERSLHQAVARMEAALRRRRLKG